MTDARAWFNSQSFGGRLPAPKNPAPVTTWDASWDSWDATENRWRHYARKGSVVVETDEIGIPLEETE